jgi:hypothetical protein
MGAESPSTDRNNKKMPTAQQSRTSVVLVLVVIAAVTWVLFEVLRTKPPRHEELVYRMQAQQAKLEQASRDFWAVRKAFDEAGQKPEPLPHVILGDGIAGAAAAVNIEGTVHVLGAPSAWANLHGIAEIWQMGKGLGGYFKAAGLIAPDKFDWTLKKKRILWIAIENVRLDALLGEHIRYLQSPCKSELVPGAAAGSIAAQWRIVDCEGRSHDIAGPVVLATGVNEARTLLSPPAPPALPLADAATRLKMINAQRLVSADDYFAQSEPREVDTLVVLGSGGSAMDVARHALAQKRAKHVVIVGPEDRRLEAAPAFALLRKEHGKRICQDRRQAKSVTFDGTEIHFDGTAELRCSTLRGRNLDGLKADLLVESLGRENGLLPRALRKLAVGNPLQSAVAVTRSGKGELIAVRLQFTNIAPPVYVIGGAADFRPGVFPGAGEYTAYETARKALEKHIDVDGKSENPMPGFAAAAFMGSEFARKCFRAAAAQQPAAFDESACLR